MTASNELHVVYGTGPVGTAVIEELLARGKRVRAVTRGARRKGLPPQVEVAAGDAADPASARGCCRGATHVYNCTNPPDYQKWPEQFPPLQRGVLAGAAINDAKLIVMENLYMYGPHGGRPMTEEMPMRGAGSRSTTRRQMAREVLALHHAGVVRAVSGRASDLFGPRVGESLAGARLFGPAVAGRPIQLFAAPDLPHSLTYIRDVGRALVTLGERDEALGQAWHIPNAPAVTPRQFVALVCAEAGTPARLSPVPRRAANLLLPLLGLFTPPLRGVRENLYQVYEPFVVDHGKYARQFGDEATPLRAEILPEQGR